MKDLIDIVSRLSSLIIEMEEQAKEQYNLEKLTYKQMNYLEAVNKLKNPNITELSAYLNLTKPTVKVAVDKLIEKDFIYKVQSDQDRRSAHLHLSEKGKLINQMHDYAHRRIAEAINRKLDPSERDLVLKLFNKILFE